MLNEFLTPVSAELRELAESLDIFSIGKSINFDDEPTEGSLVLLSVDEARGVSGEFNLDFDGIRKEFYKLKKGDWHRLIFDLGELKAGNQIEDTYFAFLKIQQEILKRKAVLIILGGTSDLAYWQFRAFDGLQHTVNLSCVDNRFRLGDESAKLNPNNYLSKIITDEPHTLFDYTHLGYQTYFTAQEELDLMNHLNFEVKRLGKLIETISESEPELRNSDMVVMNLEAIQASDFQSTVEPSPNGFNSREICSLSRYAGINNKVRSFGVYNFKAKNIHADEVLTAEILWYFAEGKNRASEDLGFDKGDLFETFYVQIPEQDLVFHHNIQTEQWWLSIAESIESGPDPRQIIPCSFKDYEDSLQGKIPDRWWKSYKKLY